MDKGEFIRLGYRVEIGEGGSFIVFSGGRMDGGDLSRVRGFSNYSDMLSWLSEEHRALDGEQEASFRAALDTALSQTSEG